MKAGTDMLAKGSQVSLCLYMVSNDSCVHSLPSRFPVLTARRGEMFKFKFVCCISQCSIVSAVEFCFAVSFKCSKTFTQWPLRPCYKRSCSFKAQHADIWNCSLQEPISLWANCSTRGISNNFTERLVLFLFPFKGICLLLSNFALWKGSCKHIKTICPVLKRFYRIL